MKKGFTLVELLISVAIFSVLIVAFVGIFLAVTQVQVKQTSVAEVNQQSQFLLQQVQYYVSRASLIDTPADAPTTTLKLWTGVNTQDPTYIKLQNGTVYLQQTDAGTLQPLTSNKVTITNLAFIRHANPPAHDTVSVSFSVNYSTNNVGQAFAQMFQTSIARVSAATFDSNLVPSSTATYSIGIPGSIWSSINGVVYFNGSNVGIGNSGAASTLSVNGGATIGTGYFSTAAPTNGLIVQGNLGVGTSNPSSTFMVLGTSTFLGGNIGIGTTTPGSIFTVVGTSTFLSGNIGIGTTTPSYALTVANGSMQIASSGAGIIFPNGSIQTVAASGGISPHIQTFTSGGTWTYPSGINEVWVTLCGGGAGGNGGATSSAYGGGGGGGAQCFFRYPVLVSASVTVTVGTAGTGGGANSLGTAGSTSSFGAYISANGGCGGPGGSIFTSGNSGGGYGGCSIAGSYLGYNNSFGANGNNDAFGSSGGGGGNGGAGINSAGFFGGGGGNVGVHSGGTGGAGGQNSNGGGGGASSFGNGGNGGIAGGSVNGVSGSGYGSGGGGGAYVSGSGSTGGNGSPGIVIVEWWQ